VAGLGGVGKSISSDQILFARNVRKDAEFRPLLPIELPFGVPRPTCALTIDFAENRLRQQGVTRVR
jgi:hypothetical protein